MFTDPGRVRLLRLLARAGVWPALALVGTQVVTAVLPVAQAVSVGKLVGALVPGSGGGWRVPVAAAVVAGLFLLNQGLWLMLTPLRALVVKRIDGAQRIRVREIAAALPGLDALESRAFQDRAARAVDAGISIARDRSVGNAAASQLELGFRFAGAFAAAGLLAGFSPVLAGALLAVSIGVRAVQRRQWLTVVDMLDADTAGQRKQKYIVEQAVYGAAKDVRLFGLSDWFAGRHLAMGMRVYGPVWREMAAIWRRQWWTIVLSVAAAGAALAVPAAAALSGRLSSAQLITYVLAAWGIFGIGQLGLEAYDIEYGLRGLRAAEELGRAYQAPARLPAPARPPAATRPPATVRAVVRMPGAVAPPAVLPPVVRFDDVVFTYPGTRRPVLDGFTLTLRPGETVAVVGGNGAGKTTFVKLLGGLYRPDSGRITVDGVDLAAIDPAAWRRRLAVLFQDFVQYPASLRDNVLFAAPERGRDDAGVRAALAEADATGLVDDLPEGLDTLLWREGSRGRDLSGGQWQRLALARVLFALAAGRRVLVLDEPTAHLDVRAEAGFHERVVSRVAGATTVLISHRLSTVRPADRILLLRDGRVAEDGSHDELISRGGDYARFFTVQAEAFTAGEVA